MPAPLCQRALAGGRQRGNERHRLRTSAFVELALDALKSSQRTTRLVEGSTRTRGALGIVLLRLVARPITGGPMHFPVSRRVRIRLRVLSAAMALSVLFPSRSFS